MDLGRRGNLLLLTSALLLLASGCEQKQEAQTAPRLVNVVKVSVGESGNAVSYSGEVRPRYESSLGFRLPGKIIGRYVEVGKLVRRGDLLARLDPQDQELNTVSAQSQLAAARSEYEQIKNDNQRYEDLYRKEFISKAEFDRRLSMLEVSRSRMEQAQAQLAVTRNQAAYTELRADGPGVVTALQFETGQVVAAGQGVVTIARTDEREVLISVPEHRLSDLGDAADISISLWADPQKTYRGRVREVSPTADPVTRTYAGKISILDADASIKMGMTANVVFKGPGRGGTITLPASALFQDNAGKSAMWVVDPASKQVKLVPVEVRTYTQDLVTISLGLQDGDLVVRAGVHKLFAGETVRFQEETAGAASK